MAHRLHVLRRRLFARLALEGDDYGEDRTIEVKQKDLVRLTTMSRSAVADGLATLMDSSAISQGNEPPARFSGVVSIPDVDRLKGLRVCRGAGSNYSAPDVGR